MGILIYVVLYADSVSFFFFQAEDGIRDRSPSRGLGDVYKRQLLNCLASHPNRVYTRDQLLDEVWGFEYYGDSRTIDVHVKRLREKLAGASDKWELKTVWGVGYKFEVRQ